MTGRKQSARQNFVMEEGSLFQKSFFWVDASGTPIDLRAYYIKVLVGTSAGAIDVGTFEEATGHIDNQYQLGLFLWTIDSAETFGFDFDIAFYQIELVRVSQTVLSGFSSLNLVKDAGSNKGSITADAGTPFSAVVAGDYIRIEGSENSGENDWSAYQVSSSPAGPTDTVVNLEHELRGPTNAADTAAAITKITPLSGLSFWVADGTIKLDRRT